MNRTDPLSDISDFTPTKPSRAHTPITTVHKVTAENGFVGGRSPPPRARPRRRRTGRNVQLNLKVTAATLARFTALADRRNWLFAETLEHALDALEAKNT